MKKFFCIFLIVFPLLASAHSDPRVYCTLLPYYQGYASLFLRRPETDNANNLHAFLIRYHDVLRNLAVKKDGVTGFDVAYRGTMNIMSHEGWKNEYEMYVLHDNLCQINMLCAEPCRS